MPPGGLAGSASASKQIVGPVEVAQIEKLADLRGDDPGFRHAGGGRIEAARERQVANQAHGRLAAARERVHELGQVVFEELLALGVHERDELLVADRVGSRHAEIQRLVADLQAHALKPEGGGAILLLRERRRIDDAHLEPPVGAGLEFHQHVLHALGPGS